MAERHIPPRAPRLVEREFERLMVRTIKREAATGPQIIPVAVSQSCDGRPVLQRIGATDCSGVAGQQYGLAVQIGGMLQLLSSAPARPISGTMGVNATTIAVGGASAAVVTASLYARRRFVDSDGNLYGPTGTALGSAPAYFKKSTLWISVTSGSSTPIVAGVPITFTGSASGGTAPYTYSWSWDDGTTATTGATPSHTYAAEGMYTVVVSATDSAGSPVTTQQAFYVHVVAAGSLTGGGIIIPARRFTTVGDTGEDAWQFAFDEALQYFIQSGASEYVIGEDAVSGTKGWDSEPFRYEAPHLPKQCIMRGIYPGPTGNGWYNASSYLFGVETNAVTAGPLDITIRDANISAPSIVTTLGLASSYPFTNSALPPERHLFVAPDGTFWLQPLLRSSSGDGYVSGNFRIYQYGYDAVKGTIAKLDEVWLGGGSGWAGKRTTWQEFARLT